MKILHFFEQPKDNNDEKHWYPWLEWDTENNCPISIEEIPEKLRKLFKNRDHVATATFTGIYAIGYFVRINEMKSEDITIRYHSAGGTTTDFDCDKKGDLTMPWPDSAPEMDFYLEFAKEKFV